MDDGSLDEEAKMKSCMKIAGHKDWKAPKEVWSLTFTSACVTASDRLRVGWLDGFRRVPREQKMLKGHLSRVIHHQVI